MEKQQVTVTYLAGEAQEWAAQLDPDPNELVRLLQEYHQQKILVRGFLHRSDQGMWSLTAQPSLRSCCIGDNERATLQVMLDGDFDEKLLKQVVSLEGIFIVDPQWTHDRALQQVFVLEKAHLIKAEKRSLPVFAMITLLAIGTVTGGGILCKKRK